MHITKTGHGLQNSVNWKIDKKVYTVPVIDRQYFLHKVRMYGSGKKRFIADTFDKVFGVTFTG